MKNLNRAAVVVHLLAQVAAPTVAKLHAGHGRAPAIQVLLAMVGGAM